MPLAFPSPSQGCQLHNGRWQYGGNETRAQHSAPPPQPQRPLNWHCKKPTHPVQGRGGTNKGQKQALVPLSVALRCPASLWAAAVWLGENCFQGGVGLRWLERAGGSLRWLGRGLPGPCWPWCGFCWHSSWAMQAAPLWGPSFLCFFCCHSHNNTVKVCHSVRNLQKKLEKCSPLLPLNFGPLSEAAPKTIAGWSLLYVVSCGIREGSQTDSILALNERWGFFYSNT